MLNNDVLTERALLVGAFLKRERRNPLILSGMEELSGLAKTAGVEVACSLQATLMDVNPATFLGKGKIAEISELCQAMDIDVGEFLLPNHDFTRLHGLHPYRGGDS